MIEGDLSDVSLPGLLQFLATESNKSFAVHLVSGTQRGELLVCDGEILAANFGLLEGNDALTELLFWNDCLFTVERLAQSSISAEQCNLKIILKQVNSFAEQMLFLQKSNVGLNTEIVPSPKFGTQEWQEALQKQPLYKEDYVVLGWVTDGRTMRQAMREFSFDVVQATSSLFRLLSTGSVDSIRPTLNSILEQIEEAQAGNEPLPLLKETSEAPEASEVSTVPQAKTLGTARGASLLEPSTVVTDSSQSDQLEVDLDNAESGNTTPSKSVLESILDSFGEQSPEPAGKLEEVVVELEKASLIEPVAKAAIPPEPVSEDLHEEDRPAEVITSDSLPAVGSPEFLELMAKAQQASNKTEPALSSQSAESAVVAATSVLEKPKVELPDKEQEPEKKSFDIRRTDPLPLVAIDIERLFQTSFHVAPFGQVALNNDALDEDLKKIVSAFKTGKTFINVATEGGHGKDPAQVLHTCKYALERGYIDPPDQVVSLTADLLLGRVELEQYLLQRRRLNGDELRDVIELARQKGMKLVELLVKMGFMTESDWDRLTKEKERFAPR